MRSARLHLAAAILAGILCTTSAAWGQLGLPSWINPQIGQGRTKVRYLGEREFNANVFKQPTDYSSWRQMFTFATPMRKGDDWDLTLRGRVGIWEIDTDALIPYTSREFPENLWRLTLGAGFRQTLPNNWIYGVNVSVGSPSDRPFNTADECRVLVGGTVRMPVNETDAWLLNMSFVNARDWLPYVPLPGAGYVVNRGRNLRAIIGAPLAMLQYSPAHRWHIDARYLMLRNVHAQVSYDLFKEVGLFTRFNWNTDAYMLHDRRDEDDRLFYYDKRVTGGFRWKIRKGVNLEVGAGWAFDRFFFEGRNYDDRKDGRSMRIADGPFLNALFNMTF